MAYKHALVVGGIYLISACMISTLDICSSCYVAIADEVQNIFEFIQLFEALLLVPIAVCLLSDVWWLKIPSIVAYNQPHQNKTTTTIRSNPTSLPVLENFGLSCADTPLNLVTNRSREPSRQNREPVQHTECIKDSPLIIYPFVAKQTFTGQYDGKVE